MEKTLQTIFDSKIIVIIRGIAPESIIDTVCAMKDGGVKCVEVTFNHKSTDDFRDTLKSIRMIRDHFGDEIAVGAGTVLTIKNVEDAIEAGAAFMISPNTNLDVIRRTKELGAVSIPGAMTPSEAVSAFENGADIIKLFPAGELGAGYIKALCAPLNHIPFMADGGITAENAADFIRAGAVGVGVGTGIANKELIEAGDFEAIRRFARKYSCKVNSMPIQ